MSVFVALMFDKRLGTARFQNVKHKASSTPFLNIGPHPTASTRVSIGIVQKTGAKIGINFESSKKKHKKNRNGRTSDFYTIVILLF